MPLRDELQSRIVLYDPQLCSESACKNEVLVLIPVVVTSVDHSEDLLVGIEKHFKSRFDIVVVLEHIHQ